MTAFDGPETISFAAVASLVNLKSLYMILYGWSFGMSLWVTFFGGVIAYKVLPRQQFGSLQHRTFPIYFSISIALSSAALGFWVKGHPAVLVEPKNVLSVDHVQALVLIGVTLMQACNQFVIGPLTSKIMFQRHKLEKSEGKSYHDTDVSAEMKTLNRRFAQVHGVSSLLNLYAVLGLGFHGLWIGNHGLGQL